MVIYLKFHFIWNNYHIQTHVRVQVSICKKKTISHIKKLLFCVLVLKKTKLENPHTRKKI